MSVDAAGRPGVEPDAGARTVRAETDDRLRAAVLAVAGLVGLVGGGWWWQAQAPRTGAVGVNPSVTSQAGARLGVSSEDGGRVTVPGGAGRPATIRTADPATGATFLVDPATGVATLWLDGDVPDPRRLMEGMLDERARGGAPVSHPHPVWSAHTALSPAEGLVKHATARRGGEYLLQYRCLGPGEMLVVIDGARAADPITSACDGSVTSTEVVGRGGLFRVSLSAANAAPLRVEAQLVAVS